jgi:hypothetical protein
MTVQLELIVAAGYKQHLVYSDNVLVPGVEDIYGLV